MTSKSKTLKTENLEIPFEKAIERLESIVTDLENGDLSLDQSLASFEEGMKLAKSCEDALTSATGRVEKIMKDFSGTEKWVELSDQTQDEEDL